jgi:hypothetical protein
MYSYTIEIIGLGCEVVACELDGNEMRSLKDYMKNNNIPLEEIFKEEQHLNNIDLGVNSWFELDDICHVYGAYPNNCRVKVKGIGDDSVRILTTTTIKTFIDDYYSLVEFDSIHSIMDEKGVLVKSTLKTKEPFNQDLLTLLVTKMETLKNPLYLVTGFMYGDEYLKLETVIAEELRLRTYINKTTDNLIIL